MHSYPSQNLAKVLIKTQEKSFDIKKRTNTGIGHDRQLEICHHTFCRWFYKIYLKVCSRTCNPLKNSILMEAETPPLKCKTSNSPLKQLIFQKCSTSKSEERS